MKRNMKKILSKVFAFALLFSLVILPVRAADDDYDYTVTIFGGLHGTVKSVNPVNDQYIDVQTADKIVLKVPKGYRWNPNDFEVTVNDQKYFWGLEFQFAGKEDSPAFDFEVDTDVDIVPIYRTAYNAVEYTVRYLHVGDNAEVYPQQTFYGNVGEKPVIAYKYKEGYIPTAYNETRTIDEDPSKNVFTFYYETVTEARQEIIDRGDIFDGYYYDGASYVPISGNSSASGSSSGSSNSSSSASSSSNSSNNSNSSRPGTSTSQQVSQPQEIVDLDNSEAPQTLIHDEPGNSSSTGNSALPWVAGIGAVAVLGAAGVYLATRKKENEEE